MLWHFCRATDTRKLERVKERALRAVFSHKTATYEQLLEWAKLPSLENWLILMYKVKHNLVPKTLIDIFTISNTINATEIFLSLELALQNAENIASISGIKWLLTYVKNRAFKGTVSRMDIKGLLDRSCNCQMCQSGPRLRILAPSVQRDSVTRITSKIEECKNTFTAMASYR